MVKGLEVFREHFRDYADRYLLIGGAACDLAMSAAARPCRATKNLDIFIHAGRQEIDGVTTVSAAQLIALKARVWLYLTEREAHGEKIDSKTIKKHKNDVFRLYQILDPASDPVAPEAVQKDICEFILRMSGGDVDLKSLGLHTGTRDSILVEIADVYRLAKSK